MIILSFIITTMTLAGRGGFGVKALNRRCGGRHEEPEFGTYGEANFTLLDGNLLSTR
jgi:hypothetical protein